MQQFPVSDLPDSPQAQSKPRLSSHDSGEECSLAHWVQVYRLVEISEQEDRESKSTVFDDSLLLISE